MFVKQLINVIDVSGLILRREFSVFISQVVQRRKSRQLSDTAKILINNLKKKLKYGTKSLKNNSRKSFRKGVTFQKLYNRTNLPIINSAHLNSVMRRVVL